MLRVARGQSSTSFTNLSLHWLRGWGLPVLGGALILAWGSWAVVRVERVRIDNLETELTRLNTTQVTALEVWFKVTEDTASVVGSEHSIRDEIADLVDLAQSVQPDASGQTVMSDQTDASRERLDRELAPMCRAFGYLDYEVVAPDGMRLAALDDDVPLGVPVDPAARVYYDKALEGKPLTSTPFWIERLDAAQRKTRRAVMLCAIPVTDPDDPGRPIASLGFLIRPQALSAVLTAASIGEGTRSYALDSAGFMISDSPETYELKRMGLLETAPEVRSILGLRITEPGVDLTLSEPEGSPTPKAERPLTHMAASAVEGGAGVNVAGYRDFRGKEVVGAWKALAGRGLAVATEIDREKAYESIGVLRQAYGALFGAVVLLGGLLLFLGRLALRFRARALEEGRLGQYQLGRCIGQGGMGEVYRAQHAFLKRPCAVKILRTQTTPNLERIARFEREVQLTAALTHPNTVQVFDYGCTEDGVFYYAMEYLEGFDLRDLVKRFGPLSEPRTVHILLQICGSLAEAHRSGLIHRDVKPANVILCHRGWQPDFVKVLDFGLAKDLEAAARSGATELTGTQAVRGTPLYLAPEIIEDSKAAGPASDIYAFGVLAYYLLTGRHTFEGNSMVELLGAHVRAAPQPPSAVRATPVDAELEAIVMACLQKSPLERPESVEDIADALRHCGGIATWTVDEARTWWEAHGVVAREDFGVSTSAAPIPAGSAQSAPPPGATPAE